MRFKKARTKKPIAYPSNAPLTCQKYAPSKIAQISTMAEMIVLIAMARKLSMPDKTPFCTPLTTAQNKSKAPIWIVTFR